MKKITDFLDTKITKKDLETALKVLHEFKSCESEGEYLSIPFAAWAKFEQLEEFLEHLVNKSPLKDDTIMYIGKRK
jgi:hypothetical protein